MLTEETKFIFVSSKKKQKKYDKDYIAYSIALDKKKVLVVEVLEERKSEDGLAEICLLEKEIKSFIKLKRFFLINLKG